MNLEENFKEKAIGIIEGIAVEVLIITLIPFSLRQLIPSLPEIFQYGVAYLIILGLSVYDYFEELRKIDTFLGGLSDFLVNLALAYIFKDILLVVLAFACFTLAIVIHIKNRQK